VKIVVGELDHGYLLGNMKGRVYEKYNPIEEPYPHLKQKGFFPCSAKSMNSS